MKTETNGTGIRQGAASAPLAVATLMGVALLVVAPSGWAAGPKHLAAISVEFSPDCVTAQVSSDKPINGMAVILAGGSWQRVKGLRPAPVYTVAADPKGANAGQPIVALYVRAGPFKQKDPHGVIPGVVGMGFDCTPE